MQWKGFLTAAVVVLAIKTAIAAGPQVSALTKELESSKLDEQVRAAQSLGELGPRAASAVPQLVKGLTSSDLGLRYEIVVALGRIGSNSQQSVPALIKSLSDSTPIVQLGAIESLRMFGTDSQAALPQLKTLLASKDLHIKVAAARAIGAIASDKDSLAATIPALIEGLGSESPAAGEAVLGLANAGSAAVPAIQKVLSGPDSKSKIYAIDAAGMIGSDAAPAVEQLLAAVESANADVSAQAIQALGAIHAKLDSTIPVLLKKLTSKNPIIRTKAAIALGTFGPANAPPVNDMVRALQTAAVNDLRRALKDDADSVRVAAAGALGEMGFDTESVIAALVAALDDSNGSVTVTAAGSLGRIGKAAVPALAEKLKDPHFQQLASAVLSQIGSDAAAAVPDLVGLLKSTDVETRREAIIALAEIGPASKSATPELIKIVNEKGGAARGAAAYALGKIGAKEATDVLKNAVDTPDDPMLRLASIWSLLQFDPTNAEYAKIAVPRLTTALSSERPRVRKEAAVTLGKLGSQSASAVPELQKAIRDEVPDVRMEAISALAEIGSASKAAAPDLISLLSEEEPPAIRQSAAYALGRIGADAKSAAPALHRLAASRNAIEKTVAAWALVHVAPNAENVKVAIPLLIQALQNSPRPEVRVESVKTLGQFGSASPAAAEALKAAVKDTDEAVRKAAEEALAKWKR